jgi:hypothetical protein
MQANASQLAMLSNQLTVIDESDLLEITGKKLAN